MSVERPQLWVFAGPNGAGKSTLVAKYLRSRLPVVNPDVIAVSMSEASNGHLNLLQAGKIALQQRTVLLASGQPFAIETTLSGNSEIKLMRDAGLADYKVNLVFVGIESALVSQGRVTHRVGLGLHFVSSDDIQRRYPRSMDNLSVAMSLASRIILVDNTGKSFRLLFICDESRRPTIARKLPNWMTKAVPAEYLS